MMVALFCSGCVAHRSAHSSTLAQAQISEPLASRFGTMAISEQAEPASFGFQKAKGRLGSATQAIRDSAALGLSGPGAGLIVTGTVLEDDFGCANAGGDPIFLAALAGVAGGATAIGAAVAGPFVGLQGLVRSLKSVSPAELLQRETALTNALNQMAAQRTFRDALFQAGAERIQGGFLSNGSGGPPEPSGRTADAILEARFDDLRLQRAGSGEASYFLSIHTHVRLVRTSDRTICFEQDAKYRSGTSLFLDWTLQGALQGVAETGYKILARYYVSKLLTDPGHLPDSTLVAEKALK